MNDTTAAALGSNYETHGHNVAASADAIIRRYFLQTVAKELLSRAKVKRRVAECHRRVAPNKSHVILKYSTSRARLSFQNLWICGELWVCPVCASKITEKRASELKEGVSRWRDNHDGYVTLNTYTLRHHAKQPLTDVLGTFQAALEKYKSGRPYQKMKKQYGIVGNIKGLEVTYGENGFHPHVHELAFHRRLTPDERRAWVANSAEWWLECLDRVGGNGLLDYAYDSREGWMDVDEYVSKYGRMPDETPRTNWSVEREIAKFPVKEAAKEGRTPFQLLADAGEGDTHAGRVFVEYVIAMKRKLHLRWSKGLPELLGMKVVKEDVELARVADDDAHILGLIDRAAWYALMRLPQDARVELVKVGRGGNLVALRRWLLARNIVLLSEEQADDQQPRHDNKP